MAYSQHKSGILLPDSFKSSSNETAFSRQYSEFILSNDSEHIHSRSYRKLATEAFEKNAVASSCIDLVASSIGDLHWIIKDRRTGERIEDADLEMLLQRPCVNMSKSEFFYTATLYRLISGNIFIRKIELNNGKIKELELLNPAMIDIVENGNRLPELYRYTPSNNVTNTRQIEFPVDQISGDSDVLHIKNASAMDCHWGTSPLSRCSSEIALLNAGQTHNTNLLKNGARPSAIWSFKNEIDKDQQDEMRDTINSRYSGPHNSGQNILSSEVDVKPLSVNAREMDYLETKKELTKIICATLGVPSQLISNSEASTFSNIEELKLHFYESTVMNAASTLATELNYWLAPRFDPNFEICIDEDQILALQPRRDQLAERYSLSEVLTTNEKRDRLGLPPIEEVEEKLKR